ncbi:hypothetical protein M1116_00250 [Patescibacteria group bacterium]|nr:hypothetical protein [Patescibacteria group bacterium]
MSERLLTPEEVAGNKEWGREILDGVMMVAKLHHSTGMGVGLESMRPMPELNVEASGGSVDGGAVERELNQRLVGLVSPVKSG